EHTEISLPQELAVEVVAVQPFRSETSNYVCSIGGRRRVGVASFRVSLNLGHAFMSSSLPYQFAGTLLDAVDPPPVDRGAVHRIDVAILPWPKLGVWIPTDGRGHEYSIAPNYRARMTEAGNGYLPNDIDSFFSVPACGRHLAVCDAAGIRATKRRPVERHGHVDWTFLDWGRFRRFRFLLLCASELGVDAGSLESETGYFVSLPIHRNGDRSVSNRFE